MEDLRELLAETARLAADFYDSLPERPVFPRVTADELREALGGPLPERATDPRRVVAELAARADPGVVAEPGGRYFGFVIGGAVPAALAADWLTSTWDQNAGLYVAGPSAAVAEDVAAGWLTELLGLPADASYAFVTGGQMANFTALAAARHRVLARAGWDVERDGLTGAPRIRVVVGAERHGTIDRALRMLGLGAPTDVVEADEQGRMLAGRLELTAEPTIVCAQAGEVNTGAFDPFGAIADACERAPNAWLHVDGAFGLWAAVSPPLRGLVSGVERADSWATDAHKWLNVPYDCGVVFTRDRDAHLGAFSARAAYLVFHPGERDQTDWTPELSRRARGVPVYAAIRSLGREGIAGVVERCCAHARRFAAGLRELGAEVLNDVELNQVLFRFADDEATGEALARVQASGEAWMAGTTWDGRAAIRISVSNWQTTEEDVDRTLAAFAGR
jgi:glutamate/tyrosine decarboxylase-like PLP-dependent enzyme